MKKGEIYEGKVVALDFPNKGKVICEGETVVIKNVILDQHVRFMISKKRNGKYEGRLLEVISKSPLEFVMPSCPHAQDCGGCNYRTLPYEAQLELKKNQVKKLLDAVCDEYEFVGIEGSPVHEEYRNKMEFSFGDEVKNGPLKLGLHKRGSFHDIISVENCRNIDPDYRKILEVTQHYFEKTGLDFYHKINHEGYLRNLLVRKAVKTGEILIDLITTTQTDFDLTEYTQLLKEIDYEGTLAGVLHTKNDSLSDAVINEGTKILYGKDYIYEEILGLKFKITPFSFFQTNSLGAEVLYSLARQFILDSYKSSDKSMDGATLYDLYSGTGTIAQMMASVCKQVVGVEIIEEAVIAARENACLNGLDNCTFIAGDVLKALDGIETLPDYIILDPPRDGIHPKALDKIARYGVPYMVYISCKPTSLARDIKAFAEYGYQVEKVGCVDMFPNTVHVETVVLMSRVK